MKRTASVLFILFILLTFYACTAKAEKPKDIDIRALADAMIDGLEYSGELEECPADVAYSYYTLDQEDCSEIVLFRAGNAVADELAIFKTADNTSIKKIEEAIKERVEYLHDGFSDYRPEEVPKINKAFVETSGNTVILCICSSYDRAESVYENYFE